jgi:hypothetical protein
MKVICVNSENKPKQIPIEKWIKTGEQYTVIGVTRLNIQKNKLGFVLAEIDLDDSCFPYHYFDSERFSILDSSKTLVEAQEEKDLELV